MLIVLFQLEKLKQLIAAKEASKHQKKDKAKQKDTTNNKPAQQSSTPLTTQTSSQPPNLPKQPNSLDSSQPQPKSNSTQPSGGISEDHVTQTRSQSLPPVQSTSVDPITSITSFIIKAYYLFDAVRYQY